MNPTIHDYYADFAIAPKTPKKVFGQIKRLQEKSKKLIHIAETGGRTTLPPKELINWDAQYYMVWKADAKFAEKLISDLPRDIASTIWNQYVTRWVKYIGMRGQSRSANIWLRKKVEMVTEAVGKLPVHVEALANEVRRAQVASDMAKQCYDLMVTGAAEGANAETLCEEITKIAGRWDFHVSLPAQRISRLQDETNEEYDARVEEHFQLAAIARMVSADWWENKLEIRYRRFCEHCRIMLGKVRKGVSAYLSDTAKQQYRERQIAGRKALEQMIARNEITDEEIALVQAVDASVSNPENRRVELMVRMRGFETIAEEQGMSAGFFTVTCPSRFHAFKTNKKSGKVYPNSKYEGTTPRDAQKHLSKAWARVRAFLGRNEIPVMGFRVCEPHHDATPHWHLLLFFKPEHEALITWVFGNYFTEADREELHVTGDDFKKAAVHVGQSSDLQFSPTKKWMSQFTKQTKGMDESALIAFWSNFHAHCGEVADMVTERIEPRMKYVPIDPDRGSATGYIAKYISKNIDGHKVDIDEESGESAEFTANDVMGWASEWGIRQFQQIGGPSVTVWRELRRLETESEKANRTAAKQDERPYVLEMAPWSEVKAACDAMEQARLASCASRWDMYVEAMGGPFAKRAERPVQIHYTFKENAVGEDVKKIRGLQHLINIIETRKDGWIINKKSDASRSCAPAPALEQSGSDAAWSSINNCTEGSKNDLNTFRDQIIDHLASVGRHASEREIRELATGRPVTNAEGEKMRVRQTEKGISLHVWKPEHKSGVFSLPQHFNLKDIGTPLPPLAEPLADIDPSKQYWEGRNNHGVN
ncbi:replication endonuclease [Enterovibrio norvegicus]|uniref:replication endonuclease n=1 Tax=Enterovibrio norvegicus TaxID=188144 RepID=UPI000C84E92F|nr:replication endonuclease [Enterovibrio norvegicus]PMN68395.1 hypothetical protein BCT27_23625 [Enterovibrio norvegicus]